jgi:hypothetical protein
MEPSFERLDRAVVAAAPAVAAVPSRYFQHVTAHLLGCQMLSRS